MPAHYLAALEDNNNLRPCCRKAQDHQVEMVKTHADAAGPDLIIFHCTCGRKHYRVAAGKGNI
jgi:hypothetical protein